MRNWWLGLVLILVGCKEQQTELQVVQGSAFGTTFNIQYLAEEGLSLQRGIDSVIEAVNRSVSTYIPDSDISKINAGDSTVVVDVIFTEVLDLSKRIHLESEGYFDPTIGVLRNAYGFGDVKPVENIDSLVLDSLMDFVGLEKVRLTKAGTIKKDKQLIYFDFNAIAKGYGIDCLGRFLEQQGIDHFLIELGGELLAKGPNPDSGEAWKVGIESVGSNAFDRSYRDVVQLEDAAMASSGNYRKFRIDPETGKRYVHTINPLDGKAEQSDVTSATVLAPSCAEADAYATTFMAMGLDRSKRLLQKLQGIEAYLTFNDTIEGEQVYITEGFKKVLLERFPANRD